MFKKWFVYGAAALMLVCGALTARADDTPPTAAQVAQWRAASEKGDPEAQYNLGLCYFNGWGVVKDLEQAVLWYRRAAEQGDADAQNNLGVCYEKGLGVPKDLEQAVLWYRRAAEQGSERAQAALKRLGR